MVVLLEGVDVEGRGITAGLFEIVEWCWGVGEELKKMLLPLW